MTPLQILKMKLGISTDSKDDYFSALITSTVEEFKNMGILQCENDLIADYTLYKHRGVETLPKNLRLRINNARLKNVRS